jgi:ribose transport system substrate-binding protein
MRVGKGRTERRSARAVAAALALAAGLTGCGDEERGSADRTDGSTSASGPATTSTGDPVGDAEARLGPWLAGTFRSPPADGPEAAEGKEVYVVSCGELLESCTVLVDGVMEAADAIGWDATLVDTKLDFASAGDAVRQAMAGGADAAIVVGIDCQHFSGALAEANAADFPVVVLNAFDCDITSDGEEPALFAAQVDFTEGDTDPIDSAHDFAAAKADWAIVQTEGDLRAINLQQEDLLATQLLGEGFAMGVERCST